MNDIQEKAKKLVDKFMNVHETAGGIGMNRKQAKQCALICVSKCIKHIQSIDGYASRDYKLKPIEDLLQVKKAIENGSF